LRKSYSDCDGYGYSHSDSDSDGHSHRNALADADVHARGHPRAMEHGQPVSDTRCALRLCADRDALLCVRWSVQRHSSEQCEPPGSRHWDVGIARADALYQ
jgi:hypothetical protein